jgi:hypothetical protein
VRRHPQGRDLRDVRRQQRPLDLADGLHHRRKCFTAQITRSPLRSCNRRAGRRQVVAIAVVMSGLVGSGSVR